MPIYPIRWQGPRRTQECKQVLLTIFEAWLSDWTVSQSDSVSIGASDSSGSAAGMQWWRAGGDADAAFIALPPGASTVMGGRLLALAGAEDGGVMEGIATDAWTDLLTRLAGGARNPDCKVEKLERAPAKQALAERHGALGFVIGHPLPRIHVFVDGNWCKAFLTPASKVEATALVTRQAALAQSSVSLGARLRLGDLSLQESLGWSVGEVLITDARSSTPAELFCADRSVASGILSHQADQRALRLIEPMDA